MCAVRLLFFDRVDAVRIQYNKGCSTGREGTGAGEGENGEGERRGEKWSATKTKRKQKAQNRKHPLQAKKTKQTKKLPVEVFDNLNM